MKFLEKIFFNPKKTDLYQHAKRELELVLNTCKGDKDAYKMQKELNKNLLDAIVALAKYRHSGGTIKYQLGNLERLLQYYPVLPVEDNGDEWVKMDCGDDVEGLHYTKVYYHHKRYSALFKCYTISNATGEIIIKSYYDVNNPDKTITFPYYPHMKG